MAASSDGRRRRPRAYYMSLKGDVDKDELRSAMKLAERNARLGLGLAALCIFLGVVLLVFGVPAWLTLGGSIEGRGQFRFETSAAGALLVLVGPAVIYLTRPAIRLDRNSP